MATSHTHLPIIQVYYLLVFVLYDFNSIYFYIKALIIKTSIRLANNNPLSTEILASSVNVIKQVIFIFYGTWI